MLAEAPDGIDIHPYNKWSLRKNPGEQATVKLIATHFGKPLPSVLVKLETCDVNCDSFTKGGPTVGQPPLPHVLNFSRTNEDGIATFDIDTTDPKNNRGFIDGQVYFFRYSINGQNLADCLDMCRKDTFKLINLLVAIRVWDNYTTNGREPTWLDHVYPVFKQYANLYPVMTKNFVDLGNYYEVINYRHKLKKSLELPMSYPGYLPVTRDLSASKREVILKWLEQEKPLIGHSKGDYTVEHLREELQTALEVEHATIPPYMTAWASIKDQSNQEVQNILKDVLDQEMIHMALVGNILNAVGGTPSLNSRTFIPNYPSHLPGRLQPDLVVPIKKISLPLLRNVFMKIEQPELDLQEQLGHVWKYIDRSKPRHCQKNENGPACEDTKAALKYVDDHCLHPSDRKHIAEFGIRGTRLFFFVFPLERYVS